MDWVISALILFSSLTTLASFVLEKELINTPWSNMRLFEKFLHVWFVGFWVLVGIGMLGFLVYGIHYMIYG